MSTVDSACTNASIGPLPRPVSSLVAPSTVPAIEISTLPSTVDTVYLLTSSRGRTGARYSVEKMSHIRPGWTSPPSSSVCFCTTPENSICNRRGRSSWCSVFMMYATPPLPDCELTQIPASYVRPPSFRSIGRHGTAHGELSTSSAPPDHPPVSHSKPLVVTARAGPQNAV